MNPDDRVGPWWAGTLDRDRHDGVLGSAAWEATRRLDRVLFAVLASVLPTEAWGDPEAGARGGSDREVHELEPVVVTGSRTAHRLSDAPVATEVITRDAIEASGAENAADLLEAEPGIATSRSFGGAGVGLQGLHPKHVLILIDGQRLGGRIDGVIDLMRIPVEEIERIEVVKGPSSALYGSDAMGGVINIITRRAARPLAAEVHASLGGGGTADVSGRVGLRAGSWNVSVAGGGHRGDSFDLHPGDPDTSGSAISQWNIAQRTEGRIGGQASVVARTSYLRRDLSGVASSGSGAVFDRRNLTEVWSVSVAPRLRLQGPSALGLSAHYTLFRDQFAYDQRQSVSLDRLEETREHLTQLGLQYDRLLADRHFLSVGFEGLHERLNSQRIEGGVGDRFRGALFVQDEWTVLDSPGLVASPGARLDVDSRFGVHATPKASVRLDPRRGVVLRGGYGMGFRAPVFKELLLDFENPSRGYVAEGNPDLRPETSHSLHVGVEWEPSDWLWTTLTGFRNALDNLIFMEKVEQDEVGGNQRYAYVNVASARTRGLELQARFEGPRGFRVDLGYSLTDSEDLVRRRALAGRALHRGTFDVRYAHEGWGLEAAARGALVGARPFYEDEDGDGVEETRRADPHATVGVRTSLGLGDHLNAFVGVRNLLDAGHEEYLPIKPRTLYAGLTGRL